MAFAWVKVVPPFVGVAIVDSACFRKDREIVPLPPPPLHPHHRPGRLVHLRRRRFCTLPTYYQSYLLAGEI